MDEYVLVLWPTSATIMDMDWFANEAILCTYRDVVNSSYFIPKKRYLEVFGENLGGGNGIAIVINVNEEREFWSAEPIPFVVINYKDDGDIDIVGGVTESIETADPLIRELFEEEVGNPTVLG